MIRWTKVRRLAMVCAVTALAALCVGCLVAATASAAGRSHRSHPRLAYWGAWIGDQITGTAAPWDMSAATRFEQLTGKGMSLLEFSSPFADCGQSPCDFYRFPTETMERIRKHGSIPVLSWGSESIPASVEEPDFQLSDVIEGRYDPYISEFATAAKNWGHPFFLRFDWEMNGNWFPWSESVNGNAAGEYVAAWRHVHDIFTAVGAADVTWVWCPYAYATPESQGLRSVYPGGAYVDWTSMDGYNWGGGPRRWKSFGQLFGPTYNQLTKRIAPHKPVMVGEFATSSNGGSRASWVRDLFAELPRRYPRVRGLIWFDSRDGRMRWPLEDSPRALQAFADGIQARSYASNRFARLPAGPVRPPR